MLYCHPIIDNTKILKNLQSKLIFNSFNDCEDNDLSNSNDSNITNDSNSVAIRDNISNNISKIQYVLLQQYIIKQNF